MFFNKSRLMLALFAGLSLLLSFSPRARAEQKALTADVVAETVIAAYGGRDALFTVRVNGIERANVTIPTTAGERQGQLTTRFIRKEKSWLDYRRIDLVLPEQALTLAYNGNQIWATLNGLTIEPRPEAEKTFKASLVHNYSSLLRYREDGSKIEYKGIQKVLGLECHTIELTHESEAKTTYYVSAKTWRILHMDYSLPLSETTTNFRVSFYDFKVVQNTLVPMRTVVRENNQVSQEIRTTGITFNIVLDEEVFERS